MVLLVGLLPGGGVVVGCHSQRFRVGWLAADHFFPEWDAWMLFMNREFTPALSLDSLRSSHPIEATVRKPADVKQIFDKISYAKGASAIRMLSAFLGQDVFLAGVARYLKQHMYGNASTRDLWASLSAMDVSPSSWRCGPSRQATRCSPSPDRARSLPFDSLAT